MLWKLPRPRWISGVVLMGLFFATAGMDGCDSVPSPSAGDSDAGLLGEPEGVELRKGGILGYATGENTQRWYLVTDDNAWETRDRGQVLASQKLRGGIDPRSRYTQGDETSVSGSASADFSKNIFEKISARLGALLQTEMGSGRAPVEAFERSVRLLIPEIEKEVDRGSRLWALADRPREITVLLAPWADFPQNSRWPRTDWKKASRYSKQAAGFHPMDTRPTRNFFNDPTTTDAHGRPLSEVAAGSLGVFFHQIANQKLPVVNVEHAHQEPYVTAPYVFPLGAVISLRLSQKKEWGSSSIRAQILLGMQPMIYPLEPAESPPAKITYAGVPPKKETSGAMDVATEYPMMLVTLQHAAGASLEKILLHVDFGIWNEWDREKRAFTLKNTEGAWRYTPFLGGGICVGVCSKYYFSIQQGLHIHLQSFDVEVDTRSEKAWMKNLVSALEIFDPQNATIRLGKSLVIRDGKPVDQASRSIQDQANLMIQGLFDRAKAKRDEIKKTFEKFPLAGLF